MLLLRMVRVICCHEPVRETEAGWCMMAAAASLSALCGHRVVAASNTTKAAEHNAKQLIASITSTCHSRSR